MRQFSTHIGALQARCAGNEDAKAELEMLKQSSDALTSDSSSNGAALAELLDKINTALQSLHTPFDPTVACAQAEGLHLHRTQLASMGLCTRHLHRPAPAAIQRSTVCYAELPTYHAVVLLHTIE